MTEAGIPLMVVVDVERAEKCKDCEWEGMPDCRRCQRVEYRQWRNKNERWRYGDKVQKRKPSCVST
jgi:hypothetical protein